MNQPFIHALADVQSADIGAGTRSWQFVVGQPGAVLFDVTSILPMGAADGRL